MCEQSLPSVATGASRDARPVTRVHYLDWLRVLAVLGVFVYHSLQPFSTDDWHVKNGQLSGPIGAVISFVDPWGVAFFFLVAGAGSFLALRWRTAGQYVRERLLRLLLPLTVAYVLLSPVQAFIEERFSGRYTGSFIAGLPVFFQLVYSELPNTILHPLLLARMYHLWFVVFLLWFALLGLPIFLWLRAPARRRLLERLDELARWRGATLLFGVPLMVAPLAVLPMFPASEDWGTFAYLFGFFVAGYVLMSSPRLMDAIKRDVLVILCAVLLLDAAIFLTGVPQFIASWQQAPSYSFVYLGSWLLGGVQAWAWVLFLLGLGMRTRPFLRPLPRTVSAAAMPFFLVHQPVILAIAYFVVRWDAGILPKWAAIVLSGFVVSALLAIALARLPLISTMFGVKRATRPSAPAVGSASSAAG